MTAPNIQQQSQIVPLQIIGGNKFGRYPKISDEETFNFIVSDEFLVPYAGYQNVIELTPEEEGRGIYSSSTADKMFAVIGTQFYVIEELDGNFSAHIPTNGILATRVGDVFMAENNGGQIIITDRRFIYVYNYNTDVFKSSDPDTTSPITFPFPNPGYVSFQNGRFIVAIENTQQWVLSAFNNGTSWPSTTSNTQIGTIQSKPGPIKAAVPVPGGGNNLLILGTNVAESWQDLALATFPYQRNSTFNVDYGCLNASSIAELDNFVVWLAVNEQSGPIIMYSVGNSTKSVSTDGINFKLANLSDPTNCSGFLFRQDGHLIYQFTFPEDNLSYAYDFNTELFFTVTDENLDYHIARQVVFFHNDYYFVSLKGGNVYRFGTQYTGAAYSVDDNSLLHSIPRIRVTPPLRLPSQRYYIIRSLGFTIENGQPNAITTTVTETGDTLATEGLSNIVTENNTLITTEGGNVENTYEFASEVVDLSISRDGGETFGNVTRQPMNATGRRKSRMIFQRLGIANDSTFQLRFSGHGRFVCTNGELDIYQ